MLTHTCLRISACLTLGLFGSAVTNAESSDPPSPLPTPVDSSRLAPLHPNARKAATAIYLYGATGSGEGTFQDAMGQPDWQGWSSWDPSLKDNRWHASDVGYVPGADVLRSVMGSGTGTSVADLGDINGDGLNDVGVTSLTVHPWRFAEIYFGDTFSLFNADVHIPEGPFGSSGPEAIYGLGDINGDGFDDVSIRWFGFEWRIYLGDPAGVRNNAVPDLTFAPNNGQPVFSVRGVGDVNDDGYDDFVVYRTVFGVGLQLQLHLGSASPDVTSDLTLPSVSGASIGVAGGDVNGDGYSDICVTDPVASPGAGSIYFGGMTPDGATDVNLVGPSSGPFGSSLCVLDVDGDTIADLIVGAPNATVLGDVLRGEVLLYRGGPGIDGLADGSLVGVEALDQFGIWISPAGDKNGDAHYDFVISSSGSNIVSPNAGAVYLVEGGPDLNALSTTIIGPGAVAGGFGDALAGSGDYNDDGCMDFLVARYAGLADSSSVEAIQVHCQGTKAYWGVEPGTPGFVTTPGYGNEWLDFLGWFHDVSDPGFSTDVRVLAQVWVQTEGEDPTVLQLETSSGPVPLDFIGQGLNYVDVSHVVQPSEYVTSPTTGNPAIHLSFRAESDTTGSDEDTDNSLLPGPGGVTVDNVRLFFDGELVSHATWERQDPGTFDPYDDSFTGLDAGGWWRFPEPFFGDFAKLISNFADTDPDRDNLTPQVGFIDDGTPPSNDPFGRSTGGSLSTTSYGVPGGYVVNHTGGLSGGTLLLDNRIVSPEINWDDTQTSGDDDYNDAILAFDLWADLPLENQIFYSFSVRSLPAGAAAWTEWTYDGYVYYGADANYSRATLSLKDLVQPTDEKIQVALNVQRILFFVPPPDNGLATPGPLFDDVAVYKFFGASSAVVVTSGSSVGADLGDVTMTFDQITGGGDVTVEELGHGPFGGATFRVATAPPTYYEISTTALYSGNIEVCIQYDESTLTVDEGDLKLYHYPDGGPWTDVTTSIDGGGNVLCGVVDQLSPFALGALIQAVPAPSLRRVSRLLPAFPNPFNPRTKLQFELGKPGSVDLFIYDASGRRVACVIESIGYAAGTHSVVWDGRDERGQRASSGVYFGRLYVDGRAVGSAERMVLLK